MGTALPIFKKEEKEGTEDWNGEDKQKAERRIHYPQKPHTPNL